MKNIMKQIYEGIYDGHGSIYPCGINTYLPLDINYDVAATNLVNH